MKFVLLFAWFFVYVGGGHMTAVVGPFDNESLCNDYQAELAKTGRIIFGKCWDYGGS